MEKEETTNRWEFEGHYISTMRDMMKEATRAWRSKKAEKFLKAYVKHLNESHKGTVPSSFNVKTSIEVAMSNIKGMARFYASNGAEMKAMREYIKIKDKVEEDLMKNEV